jgi:hypothetical protein
MRTLQRFLFAGIFHPLELQFRVEIVVFGLTSPQLFLEHDGILLLIRKLSFEVLNLLEKFFESQIERHASDYAVAPVASGLLKFFPEQSELVFVLLLLALQLVLQHLDLAFKLFHSFQVLLLGSLCFLENA